MKRIIRIFFVSLLAIWLAAKLIGGFSYEGGPQTLILAAAAFTVINIFIRPLLRLFFLPLNILTLGLFSWVVNVLVLYLLVLIISQVNIQAFDFPGFSRQGFIIPAMHLTFLATLIVSSFVISGISGFFNWLAT